MPLPVIARTANAIKRDRERCLEAGMDGYRSKPIEWNELARVMGESVPGEAPPAAAAASVPVASEAINYNDLARRCRGKPETITAVLELLVEDLSERMTALANAAAAQDAVEMARVAHALKGAAANAAADGVHQLAVAIEERAGSARWADVAAGLGDLRAEINRCTLCATRIRTMVQTGPRAEGVDARSRG
jgi:two-component system sensor histidine kinase/response regulator